MKDAEKDFSVAHTNVRQSISFLVIRLICIEFFFAILYYLIAFPSPIVVFFSFIPNNITIRVLVFSVLVLTKICFSFMVVYQWLSEYYEITAMKIIHRKGFIFRKESAYDFKQIRLAGVSQGFFGKLLNFGTIHFYDPYVNKNIYIYLIHNPIKYYNIIRELLPRKDDEHEVVSFHKIVED